MSVVSERIPLREIVEQGWKELREQVLEQLKKTIEGLLVAERDRRLAERQQAGEKVYRWGYTVRKGWQTLWGQLQGVRVPRLRGREEIGLIEKYQRHGLDEVLFALAVGGLSQRKTVRWIRQFVGTTLSPATIGAVLQEAEGEIQQRRSQPLSPARYRALVVDGVYVHYRRRAQGAIPKGVLLLAVGVDGNGRFQVLDWLAAESESAEAYEQLLNRLFGRGLETVELIVSDGLDSITAAAQIVYPAAAHQLCLVHWFRTLQGLVPPLDRRRRRKLRREFWWIWEADDERQLRSWAARFCRRWRRWAPAMVEKFQAELPRVLAYLRWPPEWRHRLRTTNLAEGFFRHLRRYLSRFPGCRDAAHSEQVLGCYVLAAEQMHA
jgi:putative transposase